MGCNDTKWQEHLAQYVADKESRSQLSPGLQEHLMHCPFCQQQLQWLRIVESALAEWPAASPHPTLAARIIAQLPHAPLPAQEWQALPWTVWVPALTVGVAMAFAMLSLPPQASHELRLSIAEWPRTLGAYSATPQTVLNRELFWAVWSGLFAGVGGVGVAVAFTAWNERQSRKAAHLRHTMAEAAQRLTHMAHRAS